MLKKGGSNWVEGDRFFDRESELAALEERVREGTHTLLTAQRRMGKTSLVRELLLRLTHGGEFDTVFVDLEGAMDPADAVAEIGVRAKPLRRAWKRIAGVFGNVLKAAGGRIEELSVADLTVKLRGGIDAGNWLQKGDDVFAALATSNRPVALAIDELPILVNRLLKDDRDRITPEGKRAADEFLSWLRKNGQAHRGRVTMILSGSVGLEPILDRAGLSAHANIYAAFDLKPWSEETAASCLAALAETYKIGLAPEIAEDMCRRLRCCIPHHVQMFFDKLHEHLRPAGGRDATLEDAERVYLHEMLTETAVKSRLDGDTVTRYRDHFAALVEDGAPSVEDVLHVLEHDGYLERGDGGHRFVSGLLEDWWRGRYGGNFESAVEPERRAPGAGQ